MRTLNLLEPPDRLLPYSHYLSLQEGLRRHRRELLLFCQHPPVLTAGVQSKSNSLLADERELSLRGVQVARIGRGGDYTAHEPGQCVVYAHVDLRRRALGVPDFFRAVLEAGIDAMAQVWNIPASSRGEAPGLYRADGAKLASIGIMFKGFFTSHGMAVNVSNDLETFRYIHPCGYPRQTVASIRESGGDPGRVSEFIHAFDSGLRERLTGRRLTLSS